MNYSNGDDELERMRHRSRRGTRSTADRSNPSYGQRMAPSGLSDHGSWAGDENEEYFDQEYSQEEYGFQDYDDGDYDDGEYGPEDRSPEFEPQRTRGKRASSRPGHAKTSGSSNSSKRKQSPCTAARPSSGFGQQERSMNRREGKKKSVSGQRQQGQGRLTKRRKKNRWRLKGILLILLAALAGYGAWLFMHRPTGIWNVAIFGVDSRDGNTKNALADVQMICSINRSTGDIKLVSVYRDTYLKINEKGTYHKINEAYFKGGHKQAVDALEENLDIKIDDYATFNWKSVAEAINLLGGVDIDVTPSEFKYINAFITETVNSTGIGSVQLGQSGPSHLDGVQAVAYSRLRLMDTDFQRTERQRKVIGLMLDKAKKADLATRTSLVTHLIPQISTSAGLNDVLPMVKDISKYHIEETAGFPFSRQTKRIGKMDCVVPATLESNVIQLHQFIYGPDTGYKPSSAVKKISEHISRETALYEKGKPAPTGGGSRDQEKAPPKEKSPAKETQPETDPQETDSAGESTQEAAVEETEPETERLEEAQKEESREIGPGIPSGSAPYSDSVKDETKEELGPGAGELAKPSVKPVPSPSTLKPDSPGGGSEGPGGGPGANSSEKADSSFGPGETGLGV